MLKSLVNFSFHGFLHPKNHRNQQQNQWWNHRRIPGSHFLEERFGSELLRLRAWRSGKVDAAEVRKSRSEVWIRSVKYASIL